MSDAPFPSEELLRGFLPPKGMTSIAASPTKPAQAKALHDALDSLVAITEYAAHASWRCEYRTRYGECHCGLDELCDRLGIDRVPPNDPEASS